MASRDSEENLPAADASGGNVSPGAELADRSPLAGKEFAQSLAKMRATLDAATDALVVTDPDGVVTDYNVQFLQLWSIPENVVAAKDRANLRDFVVRQLLSPEPFLARLAEIYSQSPPETFDAIELKDGRVFERRSRLQRVEGIAAGRVWSFRDITSHRKAVADLDRQREWFRVTLASIGDAVITTDLEANVTFLNPVAETMTGWSISEATGRPVAHVIRIINESTRQPAENPIAQVLRGGQVVGLASYTALLTKDGREIAIEDSAAPIRGQDGRVIGAVMVFRDVTERRHAEERLRERDERLRAIFDQAAVGIAISSLAGRFEQVNQKFVEIVGYPHDEVLTMGFEEITHPDDLAETRGHVGELLLAKRSDFTLEKRYLRKDRTVIWSRTTITLLKDVKGSPRRFVAVLQDITARKLAEEAVQRSEQQMHAMADSIPQLAWMAGPDGSIFWYNRKWFEYTGTTFEQMHGWGWQSVHDPSMLPRVVERWKESIFTGQPFEMEFPLRGADGRFRWFLTRVNPVLDSARRVVRWFGTNTDVDDVKRAEDALREETRMLELLNKTGTSIAAKLDLQALLQTVTDAGTQLSGAKFGALFYTKKDVNGGAFTLYTLSGAPREAFEKFGHPRATAIFGPTFEGRRPVRCDDVLLDPRYGRMAPHHGMPKGHLQVRSHLAVPVLSRGGEVFGALLFGHPEPRMFTERTERIIVGVAAQAAIAIDNARLYEAAQREILDRVHTEQRLRENETRLRVALQTAALGTWELDVETRIVSLDERCQELFGQRGIEDIAQDKFYELAHPDAREARRMAVERVSTGEIDRYDIEFQLAADGRWLRASAKAVPNAHGKICRVIGAVIDITELTKARATVEERQRELECLVAERTVSLQEAIAQMEEFSYSVSHDLRSPLRAIQSYADVLLEDFAATIGPDGREYLERIRNAGSRMDRLTRDVLTYSKIARERTPVAAVDLSRLVVEVVEQYAPSQRLAGGVRIAEPLHPVFGQESLLVQVISNLLANAIKFMAPGIRPEIRIWTERNGEYVRLWVADNGIGIEPENQAKIWGMFERVHSKQHYDGTGIGLAIVRKSVERMGGSVGVESDGVSGSHFWIQLRAVGA